MLEIFNKFVLFKVYYIIFDYFRILVFIKLHDYIDCCSGVCFLDLQEIKVCVRIQRVIYSFVCKNKD